MDQVKFVEGSLVCSPPSKTGRFTKTIFYFLHAECKNIITGKEVNLVDGEWIQVTFVGDHLGKKYVRNNKNRNLHEYLKLMEQASKLKASNTTYLLFHSLNQQSDALNSVSPIVFANSKTFSLRMTSSIGIDALL